MENKLELWYPVKPWKVTQGFGENANKSYAGYGLKGHTAIDAVAFYDAKIYPAVIAPVYSEINFDNSNTDNYRAVYQIVDIVDFSYEISYGHCNKRLHGNGLNGEPLCTMGNTGQVFTGGKQVTKDEKNMLSRPGTHIHFQLRKLLRTTDVTRYDNQGRDREFIRIKDGSRYVRNGFCYEVLGFYDGYRGCIDPAPFFNKFYAVDREDTVGKLTKIQNILRKVVEIIIQRKTLIK